MGKKELPSRFVLGEEFYLDKEKCKVVIKCLFHSPAVIKDKKFEVKDTIISCVGYGSDFIVSLEKEISLKLFERLKNKEKQNAQAFIIGYISEILPEVNNYLTGERYLNGHLLIRTYSTLDIKKISIFSEEKSESVEVAWPFCISNFPDSERLAPESDSLFIRDLIDAISSSFYYKPDDCIRRIITSVENFFKIYKIPGGKFNIKLSKLLSSGKYINYWSKESLNLLKNNISLIYKLRNSIVHDGSRINYEHSYICNKAIMSIFNLYKNSYLDLDTQKYLFSLEGQFVLLNSACNGHNLEDLKRAHSEEPFFLDPQDASGGVDIIFSGFKIYPEEIDSIIEKKK